MPRKTPERNLVLCVDVWGFDDDTVKALQDM